MFPRSLPTHLPLGLENAGNDVFYLTHTSIKEISVGQFVLGYLATLPHHMPEKVWLIDIVNGIWSYWYCTHMGTHL